MSSSSLPNATLRTSQRAPKSCTACSSRKTKCDKKIPCGPCIRRNVAVSCHRETVVVRGIETSTGEELALTYEELWKENQELKLKLSHVQAPSNTMSFPWENVSLLHDCDYYINLLFNNKTTVSTSQPNIEDIWPSLLYPSRKCSDALIAYDKIWNSWVHYAIQYPQFELEHETFWRNLESGVSVEDSDPSWLALYFSVLTAALLTMEEETARKMYLPMSDHEFLLRNWYHTALFCLYKSDFMRNYNVRTVQTIAILGICFNNFGDYNLYRTLWTCAIRISQSLGMDKRECTSLSISSELCCRLWWTLMICEWLAIPYYSPCITENDFTVSLPSLEMEPAMVAESQDILPQCYPVQYHIAMIRISSATRRFRSLLQQSTLSLPEIVSDADAHLAEIIKGLPPHLQPDEPKTIHTERRDRSYPWIPWQQVYITLVLLHQRMTINRSLQKYWLANPSSYTGPRAICLSSAKEILWIYQHWNEPITKRNQWALSLHVFVAAVCLAIESSSRTDSEKSAWAEDVDNCILYLEHVKTKSYVASRAIEILQDLVDS